MPSAIVYLGLGGNTGQRAHNLSRALLRLSLTPGIQLSALSPIYETAAWGVENQPDFLNMVAAARVSLDPQSLLSRLKGLERQLGRTPGLRWGPRPVDIDVLLFGDRAIHSPELTVPHLHLCDRQFVLVPLLHIAPQLTLPGGQLIRDLADPAHISLRLVGSLHRALSAESPPAS